MACSEGDLFTVHWEGLSNRERSRLNGTHPVLVCNDDTPFEGDNVHTAQRDTCVFTAANKESGL
jgi:hypothetical protein